LANADIPNRSPRSRIALVRMRSPAYGQRKFL
jgi:hypothetical protein